MLSVQTRTRVAPFRLAVRVHSCVRVESCVRVNFYVRVHFCVRLTLCVCVNPLCEHRSVAQRARAGLGAGAGEYAWGAAGEGG